MKEKIDESYFLYYGKECIRKGSDIQGTSERFCGKSGKDRALYHASHAGGGEERTGIFFCG